MAVEKGTFVKTILPLPQGRQDKPGAQLVLVTIPEGAKGRVQSTNEFCTTIKFVGYDDYRIATGSLAAAVVELPKREVR